MKLIINRKSRNMGKVQTNLLAQVIPINKILDNRKYGVYNVYFIDGAISSVKKVLDKRNVLY